MRFVAEPLNFPENIFILLRDLIHERIGIYYDDSKRTLLSDKLTTRMIECGLDSFLDYYYLLKYDTAAAQEWKHLVDTISVQETFFWREIDQINALVDVLVPQYAALYPGKPLRIWSAACATGEEPLTIAIALAEKGYLEHIPIEIYATDASKSAIEKARKGLFRQRSFRNLSPLLHMKYFQPETTELWRVSPELHCRIQWGTANLIVASDIAPFATAPFIFCRNVFIYFSDKKISQTLRLFLNQMPTPGYLFVGASESLLKLTNDFELQEIGGAFVYVKR